MLQFNFFAKSFHKYFFGERKRKERYVGDRLKDKLSSISAKSYNKRMSSSDCTNTIRFSIGEKGKKYFLSSEMLFGKKSKAFNYLCQRRLDSTTFLSQKLSDSFNGTFKTNKNKS